MKRIDLNGVWQMRPLEEAVWLPAQVPGSAMSDLLRAGRMNDPYYRNQQVAAFEWSRKSYEYVREFELQEEGLAADRLELVCEGLDTIAQVYVNDRLIAETANMHRTYRLNLKEAAREGGNRLRIVFHSPVEAVERMQQERYLWAANGDYVVQGYPHLRKAHHMFGWDWGPKLPDSGIWRDIYIEAHEEAALADVYTTQEHHPSGEVTVSVRAEVRPLSAASGELTVVAVLTGPDGRSWASEARIVGGAGAGYVRHLALEIKQPQLWWPNGLGEQPLYRLTVTLGRGENGKQLDERSCLIGLRTLTVRQQPDEWGESFEFVVNGVPIFAMGANYIPEDNIRDWQNRDRTERLIRDCVAAHFNCIRVWGGGFYPDDYFYDLCDQYGLIVWQDHLFACAEYEMTPSFTEEITREVEDNVRRLRHHASLGLWCGNNEMEWGWVEWGFPKRPKLRTDYVKQFEILLPELTKKLDPNTFYWVASPSSGGGFDDPNASDRGDVHYWEVWHGGKPFTEYRKHYFRFCSEFGFQSFPSLKTVEQFTAPQDRNIFSAVMEGHQKNPAGNGKILYGISENFLYPKDFGSLLYVSQLLQAEAMRYGVEHWRRNRGRCMGSIYWQLNDCWPVASWSSLDYYGRWKALHYSAKRFYAPVLLSAEEEGTRVSLSIANDTLQPVCGKVQWQLRNTLSEVIGSGAVDVEVPAMTAQLCEQLDFAEQLQVYADGREAAAQEHYLEYELSVDGRIVSDGVVLFAKPKHFRWAPPHIETAVSEQGDEFRIELRSQAFAHYVELDFDGYDARLSDNFFHLSAGKPRVITLNKADLNAAATAEQLASELKVRSLYDSYSI